MNIMKNIFKNAKKTLSDVSKKVEEAPKDKGTSITKTTTTITKDKE